MKYASIWRIWGISSSRAESLFLLLTKLPIFVPHAVAGYFCRFAYRRAIADPGLTRLIIYPTLQCDLRCQHCFSPPGGAELPLEFWRSISSGLAGKVEVVTISGGEPVLFPGLGELINSLAHVGKVRKIVLPSNGGDPDRVLEVMNEVRFGAAQINFQVSIDGRRETHDARRTAGSFERALTTLRMVRDTFGDRLSRIAIAATIGTDNIKDVPYLIDLAENEGVFPMIQFVRHPKFDCFNLADRVEIANVSAISLCPTVDEMRAVLAMADHHRPRAYRLFWLQQQRLLELAIQIREQKKRPFPCLAPFQEAVIYPNGEISFCEMSKPFAKLGPEGTDLLAFWDSPAARRTRQTLSGCVCNHPCNLTTSMTYAEDEWYWLLRQGKR